MFFHQDGIISSVTPPQWKVLRLKGISPLKEESGAAIFSLLYLTECIMRLKNAIDVLTEDLPSASVLCH